ncbi:MAG TPA: hypothetical protein DDW65_17670 [Firmicutes bacterium]|nr:hypothetical protein [Bacillota bacterium]
MCQIKRDNGSCQNQESTWHFTRRTGKSFSYIG